MKTKQKKRNTKKFKKAINSKKNQKPNNSVLLNQFQRFHKLFGSPNLEKFISITEEDSTFETLKRFKEGENEFLKIINSLNKTEVFNELTNLQKYNTKTYNEIVEVFIFFPYQKFGNRMKIWFSNFYDIISKLPEINNLNNQQLIPLYRAMTLKEFIYSKKNGVQTPSWSSDLALVPTFVKNNLLTMNDNVVLVKSLFLKDDICFIPSDLANNEKEVWVRKGANPFRTFILGEYNINHYLSKFDKNKIDEKKFNKLKELMSSSNGYKTKEADLIKSESILNQTDDIIYKITKVDIPKLSRKISKDKKLSQYPIVLKTLLDDVSESQNIFNKLCIGLIPTDSLIAA
jgi:hypothetical protein